MPQNSALLCNIFCPQENLSKLGYLQVSAVSLPEADSVRGVFEWLLEGTES